MALMFKLVLSRYFHCGKFRVILAAAGVCTRSSTNAGFYFGLGVPTGNLKGIAVPGPFNTTEFNSSVGGEDNLK